jgi:hypothetical protein
LFLYPLFSLTHEAQRKKLSKKETPRKISPRARGDKGSAPLTGGRFLKKATEKLLKCFALNCSINQILKNAGEAYAPPAVIFISSGSYPSMKQLC